MTAARSDPGAMPVGASTTVCPQHTAASAVDGDVVVLGSEPSPVEAADAGGKGAALARMIRAGLPVPPTAVIRPVAARRAEHRAGLRPTLAAHAAGESPLDDDEVDRLFAGTVTDELRRRLESVLAALGPDAAYAVRSSATAEDLGTASFAGQYRSMLNLRGVDAVVRAVEAVWASLWHAAPVAYRRWKGIPDDDIAMAVIVQRMVDAERAGVGFSVDPAGAADMVRVEHVEGLGESLVSGERTPTVTLVPRGTTGPTDAAIARAADLALRAEELFGAPQDVEWADDGATTWLVQSRPITTEPSSRLDGRDDALAGVVRSDGRYTTAGIAETLPGVLDDLVWTTAGFLLDHALLESVAALGSTSRDTDGGSFVVRIRGRSALDLDRLAQVARDLPGGSPEQLEAELLGIDADEIDGDEIDGDETVDERDSRSTGRSMTLADRWRSARHDLRVVRATRTCRREEAVVVAAIERLVEQAPDLDLSDDELLSFRARTVDLALRATVAEVSVAMAAVAAHGRLQAQLRRRLTAEAAAAWIERIIATTAPAATLRRPLRVVAELRELKIAPTELGRWDDIVRSGTSEHDLASLTSVGRRSARRMGCRSIVGGPTWSSEPESFWELVRHASTLPTDSAVQRAREVESMCDELASTAGWTRTRWLTGQLIDVRRRIVRRLAHDTVELLDRRERCKGSVLELGGVIRAVDDEIGERLAARGRLIAAGDVRHLRVGELRGMLDGSGVVPQSEIVARRRTAESWRVERPLPRSFTGARPDVDARPARATPGSGGVLEGWPASGGRHVGRIRVLAEPEVSSVAVGDVVVAHRTDASWLPVFLRAGAIVVEEGGPLSHASIVARELRLPAVVNLPGVVDRLSRETGSVVVDGTAGTVVVLDADSAGEPRVGGPS